MSEKDDGGPVYPIFNQEGFTTHLGNGESAEGISRRDWLAGLAMQGLLSSEDIDLNSTSYEDVALDSYRIADAMIAEGKK